MALRYSTVTKLVEALSLKKDIPFWQDGTDSPGNEAVGSGNGVASDFWLDKKNIIDGTYTLYANGVAMTDVTDYVLDLTTGAIVLTAAGVTLLASNALTGKYSYIGNGMSNEYLQQVLERAEKKVDNNCNSIFTDTSVANPSYTSETEIKASEGPFQDRIISDKKPLIDISTNISGSIDSSQDTVNLAPGTGANYPTSGSVIVGSEVMTYTGITTDQLTGVVRGAMETTAAAHDDLAEVHSTVLFLSNTQEGSSVVWTVQPWDTAMYADEYGLFYSFDCANQDPLFKSGVASRRKMIYFYGYDSVPEDITRLTLVFAKEMLVKDTLGSALIQGRNEFKPSMLTADIGEIERIINSYIIFPMGNT